ncbi:Lactonase, 7-bladed beta-propeller-domain-containing protein [Boeremia exigua]|uniref:Lactonase, 7-bladed beta-propeller-domain-containing protein n=1 Tax=Boeremia exigua TaxID=749465 RepID=UPI001E8E1B5D|nr:Lactonase, 7-bladed beta-propeller-domain-containing protein [Boeremia exigua]KAH6614042.1 Lactonase, 7-bladed beta-propeller-domain-containing protein [Boeremia exigua]
MLAPKVASIFVSLLPSLTQAATLFAAQSSGDLSTLALTRSGGSYSLSVTSTTRECGGNPSWLSLDTPQRLVYCLDRGVSSATKGSLNSFRIGEGGALSKIDSADAPFSGVAAEYFELKNGKRGYVTASYNKSAIGAFSFPSDGSVEPPAQVLFPTNNITGPIPSRQSGSYSHHVILDPTQKYILIPDLGADLIRVFTYDPETVAPLTELAPLKTDPGAGPRHGAFWKAPGRGKDKAVYLLFNGELSQKVYSYRITYKASGLVWEKVSEAYALGELGQTLAPNTAPTSEIAVSPDQKFVIVSSRQHSFNLSPLFQKADSDSLSTFKIHDNGKLSLVQVAPSGGYLPRQFSLNKKGDKVAVGHQGNSTVVVWGRDVRSGKIGAKLGETKASGPVVFVGWDE